MCRFYSKFYAYIEMPKPLDWHCPYPAININMKKERDLARWTSTNLVLSAYITHAFTIHPLVGRTKKYAHLDSKDNKTSNKKRQDVCDVTHPSPASSWFLIRTSFHFDMMICISSSSGIFWWDIIFISISFLNTASSLPVLFSRLV